MRYLLIPLLVFCAAANAQPGAVVELWKKDKDLKGASFAYCVINCASSEVLEEYNAHQLLIPASTLKVVTTAAVLGKLGGSYKYHTNLSYTGSFNKVNGVLEGDLIIEGSGDPSLQSEYFGKEQVTDEWAKILKEKGLREIKGSIIGDASAIERGIPGQWIWDDIDNYFGTTPCGLSFMDNKFTLLYNSGVAGSEATLTETSPDYAQKKYQINSQVIAKGTEDEAHVLGDPFSFQKEVIGFIPPNKSNYEVEAALPDPALLAAERLLQSLQKAGIKCVKNNALSNYSKNTKAGELKTLYVHNSPSLEKLIFHTNLKSNNLYCESMLRTLGKGSLKEGLESMKAFCAERGLNTEEIFMTDGCGLSRANTITASFVAQLLGKLSRDSATYKIIHNSFPVAGKSGGMNGIGKGTAIEGNMCAKTGYINRARAYCGYVTTKSGKSLAFSVMMNNYTCSAREAKLKLEKFLIQLAEL